MNRLSLIERAAVVRCLVDGNSMRATARITGVARNTIDKLLVELGAACSRYQDITLRNLACKRIQVDQVWSFCYCKQKQVTTDIAEARVAGDGWTWAAIDADTKLVPFWTLGKRDAETADAFVSDLASRLADRVQLTSDGLATYLNAIVKYFERAGFRVVRQGKHIVMTDGIRILTIPRHDPVDPYTNGWNRPRCRSDPAAVPRLSPRRFTASGTTPAARSPR